MDANKSSPTDEDSKKKNDQNMPENDENLDNEL